MKIEDIKKMLEHFYDARTSLEEEQLLKQFFSQGDVPDELKPDKILFERLTQASNEEISVPDDLEQRLASVIDNHSSTDSFSRVNRKRHHRFITVGIAASLLLASIGLHIWQTSKPSDTFTKPEDAAVEAQKALQLFAQALKKGEQSVYQVQQTSTRIQNQLQTFKFSNYEK